jgi:glucan 1,3-beta-glucosidase
MMHIAENASVYLENVWGWNADHDLDSGASLNMYNPRGCVVETNLAVWLYGTGFEHSYLFQYNLFSSSNTLLSIIQTETPYMQPEFVLTRTAASDPMFASGQTHAFSIVGQLVENTILYGAGMYSFFNRTNQTCGSPGQAQKYCQSHISAWSYPPAAAGNRSIRLHNYNTHASVNVLKWQETEVSASIAGNGFCDTISQWV